MKVANFYNIAIGIMIVTTAVFANPPANTRHTPKPGSGERKAILDALRAPVESDMHQKVIFYDVSMNVKGNWTYVNAAGRDASGKRLKRFAPQVDPVFQALLHKVHNSWHVLSWGAGTGMDATIKARKSYPQAPKSIFPPDPYDFPGDVQDNNDSVKA
jgi:hypothetical protein